MKLLPVLPLLLLWPCFMNAQLTKTPVNSTSPATKTYKSKLGLIVTCPVNVTVKIDEDVKDTSGIIYIKPRNAAEETQVEINMMKSETNNSEDFFMKRVFDPKATQATRGKEVINGVEYYWYEDKELKLKYYSTVKNRIGYTLMISWANEKDKKDVIKAINWISLK